MTFISYFQFARNAKGNVTILLDGSNPNRPAYNKERYKYYVDYVFLH